MDADCGGVPQREQRVEECQEGASGQRSCVTDAVADRTPPSLSAAQEKSCATTQLKEHQQQEKIERTQLNAHLKSTQPGPPLLSVPRERPLPDDHSEQGLATMPKHGGLIPRVGGLVMGTTDFRLEQGPLSIAAARRPALCSPDRPLCI